jgi:hypothetical protein
LPEKARGKEMEGKRWREKIWLGKIRLSFWLRRLEILTILN